MIFWPRIGYLFVSWLRASCSSRILGDEGGAKEFVETPHCVVPPGPDLRESYPALPCRATDCPVPSGLIASGDLRFFLPPQSPYASGKKVPRGA